MEKKILTYQLRVDGETGRPYRGFLREEANELKTWQALVRGRIDVLALTDDIDVIFNDEFLIKRLPFNRVFFDGEPLDLLGGNLICVRHTGEEFSSIREEDIPVIQKHLRPVSMVRNGAYVMVSEESCEEYKDAD